MAQNSNECANNCGFYGNPTTNNLCSKCYKDVIIKQTKELTQPIVQEEEEDVHKAIEEVGNTTSSSNNANRCSLCKKRVGLTGFRCRCEQTFCSLHRYSDKHGCVFDYKGSAQDAIARTNPVVKADKIDKI